MKHIIIWIVVLAVVTIGLPLCLNLKFTSYNDTDRTGSRDIDVYFVAEDKVGKMDFEEYILCVLMAEMPASFEKEALKAQSVAARTYTLEKSMANKNIPDHKGADICTDSTHCQAYISKDDAKKKWGKDYNKYLKKCTEAVNETEGLVAMYNNEPIKAVFHAFASGKTENASDVWGADVGYLKSVDSPGDSTAPKFETEKEVTVEEFKEIISSDQKVDFSDNIIGKTTYTVGGAVDKIKIGNKEFKGTKIRQLFSLRSACFTVTTHEDKIVFNVKGYGHGVGMSQYGANYYAKEGLGFKEILKKYYSGIEIVKKDIGFE